MQRNHWKKTFFQRFHATAKGTLRMAFVGMLIFLTFLYSIAHFLIQREFLEENLLKSGIVEKNMYIAFEQLNTILKNGEQLINENHKILEQKFSDISVEDLIYIIEEMKSLKAYNPFIQEMLLFRKGEQDYITSQGIISGEDFFNYDYIDTNYNREYFEHVFYNYNAPTVLPLREFRQMFNYDEESVLRIFIVPKIYKVFNSGILLLINEQRFIEFCAITDDEIKMQVNLYNQEGNLVISNNLNETGKKLDFRILENNAQSVKSSVWGRFEYVKWFDYENMIFYVQTNYYTGIVLLVLYLILISITVLAFLLANKRVIQQEKSMELIGEELGVLREGLTIEELPMQISRLKKNIVRMHENTTVLRRTAFVSLLKGTMGKEDAWDYLGELMQADCFGMFLAVTREKQTENKIEEFLSCQGYSSVIYSEGKHKHIGIIPFYHLAEEKAEIQFAELLQKMSRQAEKELVILYSNIFTDFHLSESIYHQLNASLDQMRLEDKLISLKELCPVDLDVRPGNISGELNKLISSGERKIVKKYFETQVEAVIKKNPSYYKLFYIIQYYDTIFIELAYRLTKNREDVEEIQQLFLQSQKRYSAELDVNGVCNSFYNMVYLVMDKLQDEKHSKDIGEILKYIHHHYREELYLEKVANHFNMKPKYFSYYFKREYEIGFNEYLTQLRIEEAKRLLHNSTLSIGEIGQQIGYQNQVTFNAAFKKHTGISPTSYRKEK